MVNKEELTIFSVAALVIIIVFAFVWVDNQPYDEPVIYEGTITQMYGQEGTTSTGVGIGGDGSPVITTSSTSDNFYVILDRKTKVFVSQSTWNCLSDGDYVRFTFYSKHEYKCELIV